MSSTFGCPHCGQANPLHATFCTSCGTYLKGLDAESLAQSASTPSQDEKSPATAEENQSQDPARSQPWLRPDFDTSETTAESTTPALRDQPWLLPEEERRDVAATPLAAPERLVGGLQGLIEPADAPHDLGHSPSSTAATPDIADLPYEMRRQLRQMFAGDVPVLEDAAGNTPEPGPPGGQGLGLWRRNWIYGLLLAALLFALWTGGAPAATRPHSWPGVAVAYNAIDSLPTDAVVLINWAYDPATAGEMDQTALPVIEHLIEKNAQLLVVSQLPMGPATARRLIALARARASSTAPTRQLVGSVIEGGYLPGGVASLPLLGQAPTQGLPVDIEGRSLRRRSAVSVLDKSSPALLLILASRSEEVQRWLEQIQPLNRAPVVVVSSAAIDPVIRPYVDNGQIAGLVSGYAGGIAYQDLLADVIPTASQESQRRQISGQNWALIVLLLVIAVGNLAAWAERRMP